MKERRRRRKRTKILTIKSLKKRVFTVILILNRLFFDFLNQGLCMDNMRSQRECAPSWSSHEGTHSADINRPSGAQCSLMNALVVALVHVDCQCAHETRLFGEKIKSLVWCMYSTIDPSQRARASAVNTPVE